METRAPLLQAVSGSAAVPELARYYLDRALDTMCGTSKRLCDVCRERPATQQAIYGDTGQMRALCTTCFQQSASVEEVSSVRDVMERVRRGKCDYCGAPAAEGSICCEIPGVMEEEAHFLCKQCRQDLNEFNCRPENALPEHSEDDEVPDEEVALLAERKRQRDEFMRQRVKQRRKHGTG